MSRSLSALLAAISFFVAGCGSAAIPAHHAAGRLASRLEAGPGPRPLKGTPHEKAGSVTVPSVAGTTCFVESGMPVCSLIPCREYVTPVAAHVVSDTSAGRRRCGSVLGPLEARQSSGVDRWASRGRAQHR